MTVQYINSLKDTRMHDVVTAIDAGSTFGTLEICTSAYASVLCVMTLQKPSFTEANQMITMAGVPLSGTASATGTAANARIKDSNANVVVNGLTVGTAGSDINLNSVVITQGQTVTLNSGTITHG